MSGTITISEKYVRKYDSQSQGRATLVQGASIGLTGDLTPGNIPVANGPSSLTDSLATIDSSGNLLTPGSVVAFSDSEAPPNWWDQLQSEVTNRIDLGDLKNVVITSVAVNDGIKWDGTNWINSDDIGGAITTETDPVFVAWRDSASPVLTGTLSVANATADGHAVNRITGDGRYLSEWPSSEGLESYWSFDEADGTTAYDSSGNGNDGTLVNNPTRVAGISGNALEFNGTNQYVNCSEVDVAINTTWSFWMKWTGGGSGLRGIISRGTTNGTYSIRIGSGGELEVRLFGLQTLTSGIVPSTDWEHWTIIRANRNYKFYRNGIFIVERNADHDLVNQGNLLIGYYENNEFFPGLIDEPRIYSRALTEREIKGLYNIKATNKEDYFLGQLKIGAGAITDGYLLDVNGKGIFNDNLQVNGNIAATGSIIAYDD